MWQPCQYHSRFPKYVKKNQFLGFLSSLKSINTY
ncbi:hypothetical protein F383_25482 [Gossypium arboreum]|uniref:Uncharacterized protein n=1 Tax=Gossypium arboreum TaxID=29729 RepID=A0A0B0MQ01_GOSAR|nr:hypothetical protein F383_25482 [Gossypium arboreum]